LPDPIGKSKTVAGWTSRLVGIALLGEQSLSHYVGRGSDLLLLAAGLFLLSGREGIDFLRLVLGRDSGHGQERGRGE